MNKKLRDLLHRYADKYMGAGTVTEKKLLVSKKEAVGESIPSDNQLTTTEDKGLINRTILRISHQEIENQKHFESIISMTDEDLADQQEEVDNDGKEMDEDWFNQFSRYAMGVSNEDMQRGWAKVLSREIRRPGSFSIRTLNLMSTLSRNEAEVIRRIAQYVAYSANGESAYVLSSNLMSGVEHRDLSLLGELKIIETSTEMRLNVDRDDDEDFNALFRRRDVGLLFNSNQKKMFFHVYVLTTMGMELMSLNDDVELNIDYAMTYAKMMMRQDATLNVTCSKILKLTENNVDLDDEHPYFEIGPKFEKKKE